MNKTLEKIVNEDKKESETIAFEIKCRFCGTKTGQIDLPKEQYLGVVLTNEVLGIGDSRCDACVKKYGTIQEMQKTYERTMPNATDEEFNEMIEKHNFKKDGFMTELKTESDIRLEKIRKEQEDEAKKEQEKKEVDNDTKKEEAPATS